MSMENGYLNIEHICSTCLCSENEETTNTLLDVDDYINVSNKRFTPYHLLFELNILDDAVDIKEDVSQKICTKCFNFLVQIKEFIDVCKASAVTLRECIIKTEPNETTDSQFNNIKIESVFLEQMEDAEIEMKLDIINSENLLDEDLLANENSQINEQSTTKKIETRMHKIIKSDGMCNNNASNQSTNEDSECSNSDSELVYKIISVNPKPPQGFFIKCTKCVSRFWKSSSFENHKNELLCKAAAEYVCRYCKENFESVETVENHLMELHPLDLPYYCLFCQNNFSTRKILKDHIRNEHSNEKPYNCESCDTGFIFKEELNRHRINVHTNKRHLCPHCNRKFKYRSSFVEHLREHNPDQRFKCNLCSKEYVAKYHLIAHQKTHSDIKPFKCNECDKSFKVERNLGMHLRIHQTDRPFQCEYCGKKFKMRGPLLIHMRRMHTDYDGGLKYVCNVCDRRFKLLSTYKAHEKTHDEVRKHACDQCKCTFKYAHHLRNHVNGVHLKLKPHSCTMCDKKFCRSSALEVHMRMHTGEKPYECSHCKKGFPGTQTLREHLRVHTGEKPYKCELCFKNFMEYRQLAHHTFIQHKEAKPEATQSSAEPRQAT